LKPAPARPSSTWTGVTDVTELRAALLAWFARAKRPLPWRKTRDPYAVWVSEVMLQQTQVKTVLDYYARWMRRFPTLRALADAPESAVLHAWQGLGYYARARRLHQAARLVVRDYAAVVPRDPTILRGIPGVGAYTAGAVASIAYGVAAPVVDGNVERVLCRAFALSGDPARATLKRTLWDLAARFAAVPGEAGSVNQALMELGATLCTARSPRCGDCPWSSRCRARALDRARDFPELPPRAPATVHHVAASVIEHGARVLVVETPSGAARWASLWVFPHVERRARETSLAAARRAAREATAIDVERAEKIATLKYTITRHRFTLDAVRLRAAQKPRLRASAARLCSLEELRALAMPSVHRRLAELLGARRP